MSIPLNPSESFNMCTVVGNILCYTCHQLISGGSYWLWGFIRAGFEECCGHCFRHGMVGVRAAASHSGLPQPYERARQALASHSPLDHFSIASLPYTCYIVRQRSTSQTYNHHLAPSNALCKTLWEMPEVLLTDSRWVMVPIIWERYNHMERPPLTGLANYSLSHGPLTCILPGYCNPAWIGLARKEL